MINFFNKTKTKKIITIVYFTYIFIFTIYLILQPDSINIENAPEKLNIINYFSLFFLYVFISIMINLPFTAIYIGILIANKTHRTQKLEKVDYKNDIIYRDIIKEYSPGVLSYIDNFELGENHIIATILNLELKNKIKIEDKIIIIDEDHSNLSKNEIYIFYNLKNNTYNEIYLKAFEQKSMEDSIKKELLEKNNPFHKNPKIIFIITPIIIALIYFNTFSNFEIKSNNVVVTIMLILLFIALLIAPYALITYIFRKSRLNKSQPYKRSKLGSETNEKLEGLKKYIKEFSILSEREQKEIKLWREYLIYSVMFNMNKKVVEEVKKKINVQ